MSTGRWLLVIALFASGCAKSKPEPAVCTSACEHLYDLEATNFDTSARQMAADPRLAAIGADLKSKVEGSRASDLATCQGQCMAGKINTSCALAARDIDRAMKCTNRNGGQH